MFTVSPRGGLGDSGGSGSSGGEGGGEGGGVGGGAGSGGSNHEHCCLGVATQSALAPQLQLHVELTTVPSGKWGAGAAHVVVARTPAATPWHSPQYAVQLLAKAAQPDAVSRRSASVHAQAPSGAHVSGGGGAAGGALTRHSASLASPHSTVSLQKVAAQQLRPAGQSAVVAHGVHTAIPEPEYSDHCVEHQFVISTGAGAGAGKGGVR